MSTIIDDSNIRTLVNIYINDKSQLPNDLNGVPIGDWDVSRVTDMSNLFKRSNFNEPINNWNVSNVANMIGMFDRCTTFNQPLNKWNVSNVTNMAGIFDHCTAFNQPLNEWNVSNVTSMANTFVGCEVFNQLLNEWNVSNVTNMDNMFSMCKHFNKSLNDWNVSHVTRMVGTFYGCDDFNQPLNNWDVSNVTVMNGMFTNCLRFNQPLNDWNVSNVTSMVGMFQRCAEFNQPLNNWNVNNVTVMNNMFSNCLSFNQPLTMWNINPNVSSVNMFLNCPITNDNMPILPAPMPIPPRRRRRGRDIDDNVDPRQVHKAAAKIDFEKLINILKSATGNNELPINLNYPTFIKNTITDFINQSNDTPEVKAKQIEDINNIMTQRLNELNYNNNSPLLNKTIYYTLEYVKLQSPEFKNGYVNAFISECLTAYGGIDGMTCATGALERVILSLPSGIVSSVIQKPEYENIVDITIANPDKLVLEYIRDWYKLHKKETDTAFVNKSETEKKADLKQFLINKFQNIDITEKDKWIDAKIEEIADNIGYEEDDFLFGGRKRKTKKNNKKTKKNNKKTKKNNKKTKKSGNTNKNKSRKCK
jgi:surface protein